MKKMASKNGKKRGQKMIWNAAKISFFSNFLDVPFLSFLVLFFLLFFRSKNRKKIAKKNRKKVAKKSKKNRKKNRKKNVTFHYFFTGFDPVFVVFACDPGHPETWLIWRLKMHFFVPKKVIFFGLKKCFFLCSKK